MNLFFNQYAMRRALMLLMTLLMTSCMLGASGSKPQHYAERYLLSYPSPSWEKADPLPVSVKLDRFSLAAAYNSSQMIFRDDAYRLDSFNYNRWAVNPADMITDALLSDLRASGLFGAVFSRYETDDGRFRITGGVKEFYLKMEKNNKTAVISLTVSLQDVEQKEFGRKMMYQKKYTREEPLTEATPHGYALAASLAMQTLSHDMISDVCAAVSERIKETDKKP